MSAPETHSPEGAGETSRRSFLAIAAAGGAVAGCLAHAAAWGRALSPLVKYEPPSVRRLGPPARFPEGTTFLPAEGVFVLRAENQLKALSAVCTHLGCTVDKTAEGFRCPCHGSVFGPDGGNRAGPAPRPLPWRPLALAGDGSLLVDLGAETGPETALTLTEPK